MRRVLIRLGAVIALLHCATPAFAQGGGASSTGTIQGRVVDAQGAVLPGVTVTATSAALIQPLTTVTSESGNYRFPAVPPGTYALSYDLPGFTAIRRDGIEITLGFTAHVNVELGLASVQETVTVSGQSPVIDTTTTRVQQNFTMDQLQSIPNGRDMWSLLAVTPAVQMMRIDVGGNRAGTQTAYNAYGQMGQVRVLIEGINTTEGTTAAGFYFDYASLEEAFLGTSGQSAEMPNPGVQSQFIARSGGNQLQGDFHADWYNNSLQGSNIPEEYTDPTAFNGSPIREHSNEIDRYYDFDFSLGGPIVRDRAWAFGSYRQQFNAVSQPNFAFDKTFDTKLWNPVAKVTFQANQNHKLIGYYQWGQKVQPNRLPFAAYNYASPEQTFSQDSGSWVYKGEWNGTLSERLYVEARYGDFGYYFPLVTNSPDDYFWHDSGLLVSEGAHQKQQLDRDRKQYTGAATYFIDSRHGSHTIKFGAEVLKEQAWEGFESRRGGDSGIEHIYNNGVSTQVIFGLRTASCEVGGLDAHDCLTARAALDQFGTFVNDTWAFKRLTMNAGVRFDRYTGWLPEQEQLAATTGPVSVPAKRFSRVDQFTWNVAAPRFGVVYDLAGDGKTVLKANYGLYWHNPGVQLGGAGNPNTANKSQTHAWNDLNGDRRWQPGEEGVIQSSSLEGNITVDPDVKPPYTHEASVWIERQLTTLTGLRAGFVYKTEDDLFSTMQPYRGAPPFADAYTVPFEFVDIGADGRRGTTDDRTLTLYGMPTSAAAQFPATQVVTTTPEFSRYKTIEVSANKRYGNRWSASIGGSYTMLHDFPTGNYPLNPNLPYDLQRTQWNFKVTGSYDLPHGVRISPVLRHQSGANFARTLTISAPAGSGLTTSGTAYAEPADANREDDIWVFDVRVEKGFTLSNRMRVRAYLDAFNISNSHAAETRARATGPQFLKPTALLAPFTTRVGFRIAF